MTVSEKYDIIEFTFDDTWVGDGLKPNGGSDYFWFNYPYSWILVDAKSSGNTCTIDNIHSKIGAGATKFFIITSSKITAISFFDSSGSTSTPYCVTSSS